MEENKCETPNCKGHYEFQYIDEYGMEIHKCKICGHEIIPECM